MIELTDLTKTYQLHGNVISALEGINLCIQPGTIYGFVGESGAGKSTLLRCMNYLEVPTAGQVLINQQALSTYSVSALREQRRKIGMIFQEFNLLGSRTAFDNIALPLELLGVPKAEIKQTVLSLLGRVNLQDRAQHYPDQLSGGQKQRVAIARALATGPDILLCDEATSALDPASTRSILQLLKQLNAELNLTIILITHEMDVVREICDCVGILEAGRLIESGSVLSVFSAPKTAVAKRLVSHALRMELPEMLQTALQAQPDKQHVPLVRLLFVGETSGEPFLATLIRRFAVDVNIVQANIEHLQSVTLGFTVCELRGDDHAVKQSLDYLRSVNIDVEVLGYV